jgi:hypothetical protein
MPVAYSKPASLSPVPDIRDVAREAARNDEYRVHPDDIAGTSIAGCQAFGGDCDPAEAILIERPGSRLRCAALLHFDEGEDPATPGDKVNFAARHTRALGKYPPSL